MMRGNTHTLFSFQAWLLCKAWPCWRLWNLYRFPGWNSVVHQIPPLDGLCRPTHCRGALVHKDSDQVRLCRSDMAAPPTHTCSSCWPSSLTWLTSSRRYRLTAIAVDHSAGPHQNYTVIFVGSEAGVVLKILAKTSSFSLNDSVLLEEIEAYNHAK